MMAKTILGPGINFIGTFVQSAVLVNKREHEQPWICFTIRCIECRCPQPYHFRSGAPGLEVDLC